MLDKAIKYFQKEYEETKKYLESGGPIVMTRKEFIDTTKRSCLGVAFFVQECGVEYKDINPHYEEIVKKLNLLLDN